jgi:large subunit ribosomal protein L18
MTRKASDRVPFRRRREGKTDYRHRLKQLKSGVPRAVVRKTLTKTIVQFIKYDQTGDKVLAQAVSTELKKFGWDGSCSNIPSAYLTGLLAAKRAKGSKVKEAVLDIGLHSPTKGSKMFASLKGIIDGGVEVPHGEEVVPSDEDVIKKMDESKFQDIKNKILEGK